MNYRRLKGKKILICVYAAAHTNTRKQNRPPGSFRASGNFAPLDIAAAAQENDFISICMDGSGARLPGSRGKGF